MRTPRNRTSDRRTFGARLLGAAALCGLRSASLHIVRELRRDRSGVYVVSANAIDETGNLLARKEIICKYLFLCGGSMGTSQLLVRARETGTLENLNDAVGTQWGPNSDIFVMRGNSLWNPTGDRISTVPATGFRTVDQQGKAVFSMDIPFPLGVETFVSFNIVMTENPEAGRFVYNPPDGCRRAGLARRAERPCCRQRPLRVRQDQSGERD